MDLSYIIPISNSGKSDFGIRVKNLQYIYDVFLAAQQDIRMEVVFVEQVCDSCLPTYASKLKLTNKNTRVITISWPVYNKGWSVNVGVVAASAPVIMIGEADCLRRDTHYCNRTVENFVCRKNSWAFAWDNIEYLSREKSKQYMNGCQFDYPRPRCIPRPNGPEGGILIYQREFYLNIGGMNEWLQGLGGPDNELADRARHISDTYVMLEGSIYHLWHPIVKPKESDKNRNYNKKIVRFQRKNMNTVAPRLAKYKNHIGDTKYPLCKHKSYFEMRTS